MSDIIEIAEKIEESFNIEIDNKEAESLSTVGLYHDYVLANIKDRAGNKCLSQAAYYWLRKDFESGGISLSGLTLSTPMNDILNNKRKRYNKTKLTSDLELPDLGVNVFHFLKGKGLFAFRKKETIASFTKLTLALNFDKISSRYDSYNSDEVLNAIKQIIAYQLGLEVSKIQRDDSLTTDLMAD